MSESGPARSRLYILIILMTVIWAGNVVAAKLVLREIPPLLAVGLRMIIAALCMLPIYRSIVPAAGQPRMNKRDILNVLLLGVLGVGLNQMCFVLGMSRTSVSHGAIILGLTPVAVLLLAALVGQEPLRPMRLAGMGIALGGVGLLQFTSTGSRSSSLAGDLLVLLGTAVFAAYTVAGKGVAHRLGAVPVNTFAYIASAAVLLPVTLSSAAGFDFTHVSWIGWTGLLYMAVLSSALCYLIYSYALSHIAASRVSAFSYMQPVLATLMAIPAFGEYPTRSLVLGGALVFAGVFVAERT